MNRTVRLACVAAVVTVVAGPAQAQQAGGGIAQELRQACQADMKKLCDGVQPGGGRLIQCLRSKQGEATPACQAALKKLPARQ